MAFTGWLGIRSSKLGNIVLGESSDGLGSIYEPTVTTTIALVSTGTSHLHSRSGSSPITLTQTATGRGPLIASASSPISLSQSDVVTRTRYEASSALSLTSTATGRGALYKSASTALALSDLGHLAQKYLESATSVITVASSPVASGTHRVSASSPLSLTSIVDTRIKIRSADSPLSLTSTATTSRVHTASSTLSLLSTADYGYVNLFASSHIDLSHVARPNPFTFGPGGPPAFDYRLDGNTIVLGQTARSSIKSILVTQPITLGHSLICLRPVRVTGTSGLTTTEEVYDPDTISFHTVDTGLRSSSSFLANHVKLASNIISFATPAHAAHVKASGTSKSATTAISLTSSARLSKTGVGTSPISLVSAATSILSNVQPETELELEDIASAKIRRGVVNETEIEIQQSVAFVLLASDTLCNYSPFIGSTTDPNAPAPPPAALPTLVGLPAGVKFRLQYPYTGTATDTLDIKAPDLGNLDRLTFNRINRETRGGTLIVYADPIWPKIQTQVLQFSGLKRTEAQALLTFINTHLGEQIKLLDWEGREWTGVIMTPNEPITEVSRNRFAASFEFEGQPA